SSDPSYLTAANGVLMFAAGDATHGYELWRSDGTAAGTYMVKDIVPGSSGSNPQNLIVVGGRLYFTADDGVHGRELWTSDGTAAGTYMLQDIDPGSAASNPLSFYNSNGNLYFTANDGTGPKLFEIPDTTPPSIVQTQWNYSTKPQILK